MAMRTDEAGRKRWEGLSKEERAEIARAAVAKRWAKWRREHPEKKPAVKAKRATEKKEPIAQAMARKRWDKTPASKRSQIARDLANKRWGGEKKEPKP